jgi:glycosyltransferase involved in cell wall biosynthesis
MNEAHDAVSVIITVKNDADGVRMVLNSLARQTCAPAEIIVVDGGSTDGTLELLGALARERSSLRVLSQPGANIAAGRNIGTRAARGGIIATTDCGCCAAPDWLKELIHPFDVDASTDFVAGFYELDTRTLFERVVGLATMRGQLDPVREESFNPSGRSMAYRKDAWERAGGWPQWLRFSEDTLFDHKMRELRVNWRFARRAVVRWRPRSSFFALAKQFYSYGTGRGHTQIGARDFAYNLRNLLLVALTACLSVAFPWALPIPLAMILYFYVWTFHAKAAQIARHSGQPLAYPMTLAVMWVVLFSNLAGYVIGTWQRWLSRGWFRESMQAYMATE